MMLLLLAVASLQAGLDAHARGDYAAAREALKPLAVRGSPVAETLLGGMAARGQGGAVDPATAAGWWLRAANRGYAPAQLALARALAEGRGVAKDVGQAWVWARRAARAGGQTGQESARLVHELDQKLTKADRNRLETGAESFQNWP
jgi:TPR repeat protein